MKDQVFVHYTYPEPDKVDTIENWSPVEEASNDLYKKPYGGIWTSPLSAGWSWSDWCDREDWTRDEDTEYRLSVEDGVSVYTIDSQQDLCNLIEEYGRDDLTREGGYIDFESAFEEYDGIHLTTTGQEETRHSHEADLYGWDVECVLWDGWYFTEVEELREKVRRKTYYSSTPVLRCDERTN